MEKTYNSLIAELEQKVSKTSTQLNEFQEKRQKMQEKLKTLIKQKIAEENSNQSTEFYENMQSLKHKMTEKNEKIFDLKQKIHEIQSENYNLSESLRYLQDEKMSSDKSKEDHLNYLEKNVVELRTFTELINSQIFTKKHSLERNFEDLKEKIEKVKELEEKLNAYENSVFDDPDKKSEWNNIKEEIKIQIPECQIYQNKTDSKKVSDKKTSAIRKKEKIEPEDFFAEIINETKKF